MLGGAEIYSKYPSIRLEDVPPIYISVYCAIVRNMGVYSRGAIYPSISQNIHSALLFVSILCELRDHGKSVRKTDDRQTQVQWVAGIKKTYH